MLYLHACDNKLFLILLRMLTIYGSINSSAGRCLWLLEELGVPYINKPIDFRSGEHKSSEYLKLNPNGKVPTLVDGEYVLWESYAINWYLTEKYRPEWLGGTIEERALVWQWSLWSQLHVQKYFDILLYFVLFQVGTEEGVEVAKKDVVRYLEVLDKHLSNNKYMVGEVFTLADLNLASVINVGMSLQYDISSYTHIERWMTVMKKRPAFVRLMENVS